MKEDHAELQKTCQNILKLPEVRFAGFLDYMGNLVAGGFRADVEPLKDDAERKKMFIEAVIRIRTRQEFDANLGPVSYAAARRKKVITMTVPFEKNVLFLSLESNISIDEMGEKILQLTKKIENY